jgi:hypothetical protein
MKQVTMTQNTFSKKLYAKKRNVNIKKKAKKVQRMPVTREWKTLEQINPNEYPLPSMLQNYWVIKSESHTGQIEIILELEDKISALLGRPVTKVDLEEFMRQKHLTWTNFNQPQAI